MLPPVVGFKEILKKFANIIFTNKIKGIVTLPPLKKAVRPSFLTPVGITFCTTCGQHFSGGPDCDCLSWNESTLRVVFDEKRPTQPLSPAWA